MSCLIAVTSIPTDSGLSQLGQSYERAFQDFAGCTALMTLRLTWVNSVLQCGHKLIDPPSLVGSGVEIASYREGVSPIAAGQQENPMPGKTSDRLKAAHDRMLDWCAENGELPDGFIEASTAEIDFWALVEHRTSPEFAAAMFAQWQDTQLAADGEAA